MYGPKIHRSFDSDKIDVSVSNINKKSCVVSKCIKKCMSGREK